MITLAKSRLHQAFCDAVRHRRAELGMTQKELAERLGVATANVTQTESGRFEPTLSKVERYAEALETSVGDLLGQHSPIGN